MAFDGIVTKAISQELQHLSGARIDKVYQPNKNEIIIGLFTIGCNYALIICIDSQNGRIHFITGTESYSISRHTTDKAQWDHVTTMKKSSNKKFSGKYGFLFHPFLGLFCGLISIDSYFTFL